jgi:propionyl-CoA carboxylase alpha chain
MGRNYMLALGEEHIPINVLSGEYRSPAKLELSIAGTRVTVETEWRPGQRVWRGRIDGEEIIAQVERIDSQLRVERNGASRLTRLLTPRTADLAKLMPERVSANASKQLRCPMPGVVTSVVVGEGQSVEAGETLATVEAMKMENVLKAERAATVAKILVKPGDSLPVDAVIMEFA